MDLSQTLSNLASANQHLAAAHNFTLTNLHWLVNELRKPQRTSLADSPESREKGGKTYCRSKHSAAKRYGKVRSTSTSTSSVKVRQLKKLPAFDESVDNVDFAKRLESEKIEVCLQKHDDELQEKYERLMNDLEDKRLTIERLTRDIEESNRERERDKARSSELAARLEDSELERARLLARLETFQSERDGAERRSSSLEARLAESEAEGRRHALAAEQRIRALESAIEAGGRAVGATSTEIAPAVANGKDSETDGNADAATSSSDNLEDFKKELLLKREARQRAIAGISAEIDRLKRELEAEKAAHSETAKLLEAARAKAESKTDKYTAELVEALRLSDLIKISDEVTSDLWLQLERTDDLRFQLENQPEEHHRGINSLQRITEETRAALSSRKQQVNRLKDRLAQIAVRLRDRSFLHESDDISQELERQVKDIGRWRTLIDERSRILAELNDYGSKQIHELKVKLDNSKKENQSLEEELRKTEDKMDNQDAEILNLESQLGLAKADCRDLKNQMSVINSLFTQMLLSASSAEMDLDRLTQLLQENHDLISGMAKEKGTEAAALPKLLLDIIEQVDGSKTKEAEKKKDEDDLQEENIAHNLPKVWRVLLELLSCHVATAGGSASSAEPTPDSCYKSVDTPTGPRLVISVSKTYIRLKELILEKKHLEKEMNRMKTLNSHLENKLSEQEKRLSTVSDELSKTWTVVGRMEAQHQQLHTHEKILRYELQQKRKMLQELKQELEYCREKWESARQKNNVTEMQWRSLRREFAARKALAAHSDSFNNSGESGFSDEREEESDEEDDNVAEVGKKTRPAPSRRRVRKDGTRSMKPDTESEQPTDTECSEPKTTSLSTSGQRTPTPETETEIDSSELNEKESFANAAVSENVQSSDTEASLDPFDKALSNVIQNLIVTDETSKNNETLSDDSEVDSLGGVKASKEVYSLEENLTDAAKTEFPSESKTAGDGETNSEKNSSLSVFKIGPFPTHYYVLENTQFCNPSIMGLTSQVEEKRDDSVTSISQPCTSQDDKSILKVCETSLDVDNASIDSQSSLETIKEFTEDHRKHELPSVLENTNAEKVELKSESPSISSRSSMKLSNDSQTDKVLNARAERLRNLEEQAQWLVKKVYDTNRRRSALNSRLEELHEAYGSIPSAPPMPDVLPSFRLRSEIVARSDGGNDCEKSVESGEERVNEQ